MPGRALSARPGSFLNCGLFAPVKLAGAVLLAVGLGVSAAGLAGAIIIAVVCAAYVPLLAAPGRRDPAGLIFFGAGLAMAIALIAVRCPAQGGTVVRQAAARP